MSEYEYKYTEQSVDIREWTITSPRKLTEEEVQEIGMDWGSFTEGETSTSPWRMRSMIVLLSLSW